MGGYEKNVEAEPNQAATQAWIFETDVDQGRSRCSQAAAGEGAQASRTHYFREVVAGKPLRGLGPERRLLERWQFRRFFGKSQLYRLGECLVYRIPNEVGHFRLGITLKCRATSVERNRVKKQIRTAFREHGPALGSFYFNVVIPAGSKLGGDYPFRLRLALDKELADALSR